jgi:transcriptional regulator with AAA-type ATPase domain
MLQLLLTCLGTKDVEGTAPGKALGPVAEAVAAFAFDEIHILADHAVDKTAAFVAWLETRTQAPITVHPVALSTPTHHRELYERAIATCAEVTEDRADNCQLNFHVSPDSHAMDSVWLLVAATHYPAKLIESSTEAGLPPVVLRFEISAELTDSRLTDLAAETRLNLANVADVVHRSREVTRVLEQAARVGPRSVPVLVASESGTGKTMLARAIHASSGRKGAFIAINCGAIPHELIESELFGHKKGAFTGAACDRAGAFEVANHGTLFLDGLGELPLDAQVKLLRVMLEREVIRMGSADAIKVDVRIVAATPELPRDN